MTPAPSTRRPDRFRGEWLARLLLRAFPREFRAAHADELVEHLRTERADPRFGPGPLGAARFWRRALVDLGRGVVRVRRRVPAVAPANRNRAHVGWIAQDLRHAARALARTPAATLIIAATLAVGIGLNTAIFTAVDAVLLRPFDYRDPDELVYVASRWTRDGVENAGHAGLDFTAIRERARTLADAAAITSIRQNLTGVEPADQVRVGWVSTNFFALLGVDALLGRAFAPDDPPGTAVLSHALWQRAFGARPDAVGRVVTLDGHPYTIVGVMPAGFRAHLPRPADDIAIWKVPDDWWQNGDVWSSQGASVAIFQVIGRLADGADRAAAEAEMETIAAGLRRQHASYEKAGLEWHVQPLFDSVVGSVRPTLLLLFGAVGLVLLIACANVANLVLVRAEGRRRELAIRLALGARRARVAWLLVAESLLLALAGGGAGLGLGLAGARVIGRLAPPSVARLEGAGLDVRVFAFTLGVSLAVTLLVGLLPAIAAGRVGLAPTLREGAPTRDLARRRFSHALVVAQVALSLVLLVGAGLLTTSLTRMLRVDGGMDYDHLLTFAVSLPSRTYERPAGTDRFLRELEDRIEALPGVRAAGVVWPLPLSGANWSNQYVAGGVADDARRYAAYRVVTPGYFEAARTPILEGRTFGPGDPRETALVSRRLAEAAWPGESPVGKTISANPWGGGLVAFQVVGVVGDVRAALREPPAEAIYFDSRGWSWTDWEFDVVVRSAVPPLSLVAPIRAELAAMDASIPMADPRPMRAYVDDQVAANRFAVSLVGLFAGVAAALAALGLYGVLSYSVARRAREIGIRVALGSERGAVVRLIVAQGLRLTLAGIAIGIGVSLWATDLLSALLFDVTPTDPATFAGVAVALAVVGGLAAALPARRATEVDPIQVLRAE